MYGQTNCFVLPEGVYGIYEMINNEVWIMSNHAAWNLAYQDKTLKPFEFNEISEITGMELIGT